MIICLGGVLDDARVGDIRRLLDRAPFVEGRATAGWSAVEVKNNLQLDAAAPVHRKVTRVIEQALVAHSAFVAAALPKAMSPLLISRCDAGMGYGSHVDNALMGDPGLRTDLAFTLFLSEPESYEGGELVIDDAQGEQAFKLAPGTVVLYPATTLHRVETVKSGQREVAVGWVQSLIRDPRVREMLFDLDAARRSLFETEGKSSRFDLLSKTYSNLMRMFAET